MENGVAFGWSPVWRPNDSRKIGEFTLNLHTR